jgi:hypothetical protein
MKIKPRDRVVVAPSFPAVKARINGLAEGDAGKVVTIIGGIALVDWDKGYRTTANVCDLDPKDD